MTVLSAQTVRALCRVKPLPPWPSKDPRYCRLPDGRRWPAEFQPLISPFSERTVFDGKTFGLGPCTYDCRIDQPLQLLPGATALASTMERFVLPDRICGTVLDKSSFARIFVSAFNTHLDPGWEGYLTVELVNLGTTVVEFIPGAPLCQIKFEWLDTRTDRPYQGKYQGQGPRPTKAIEEKTND